MSLQTLAFLLGCGLIVIAIVGGGIEAKEVKVPKLSPIPRILSAVFGIGLVVGAVGGLTGYANWGSKAAEANAADSAGVPANSSSTNALAAASPVVALPLLGGDTVVNGAAPAAAETPPPPPPPAPPREGVRTVRVTDVLGPQQDYERIQVYVGGRQVALIALDRHHRRQAFNVEIQDGDEYTLVGSEASREADGTVRVRMIRGSGTFDGDHSTYAIWSDDRTAEIMTAELRGQ